MNNQEKFITILDETEWMSYRLYRDCPTIHQKPYQPGNLIVSSINYTIELRKNEKILLSENCQKKQNFIGKLLLFDDRPDESNRVWRKYQEVLQKLRAEHQSEKDEILNSYL
jgi:hypothetical protein